MQPGPTEYELVRPWVENLNDTLVSIRLELGKIPHETASIVDKKLQDKANEVLSKVDALPERMVEPLREIVDLSKREILAELVRISSQYDARHSHDSISAAEEPMQEITKGLTVKQRKLMAILLDSGFLSYAEIGEKLGITHESAKNLINRLLKDEHKARLFSKQGTDEGVIVGISSEVQDEILKRRYRTTPNDSP